MRAYLDAARLYDSQDGIDKDMVGLELPSSINYSMKGELGNLMNIFRNVGLVYIFPNTPEDELYNYRNLGENSYHTPV